MAQPAEWRNRVEKRRFVTRASSYRGKEKTDGRWPVTRRTGGGGSSGGRGFVGGSCGEEEGQVWMNDFWISKGMKSSKLRGVERGTLTFSFSFNDRTKFLFLIIPYRQKLFKIDPTFLKISYLFNDSLSRRKIIGWKSMKFRNLHPLFRVFKIRMEHKRRVWNAGVDDRRWPFSSFETEKSINGFARC